MRRMIEVEIDETGENEIMSSLHHNTELTNGVKVMRYYIGGYTERDILEDMKKAVIEAIDDKLRDV